MFFKTTSAVSSGKCSFCPSDYQANDFISIDHDHEVACHTKCLNDYAITQFTKEGAIFGPDKFSNLEIENLKIDEKPVRIVAQEKMGIKFTRTTTREVIPLSQHEDEEFQPSNKNDYRNSLELVATYGCLENFKKVMETFSNDYQITQWYSKDKIIEIMEILAERGAFHMMTCLYEKLNCEENELGKNILNEGAKTAVIKAAENGHFQVVAFLRNKLPTVNLDETFSLERNIFICAARKGRTDLVEEFLRDTSFTNHTDFSWVLNEAVQSASCWQHNKTLETLLNGRSISMTCLDMSVSLATSGNDAKQYRPTVQLLLRSGDISILQSINTALNIVTNSRRWNNFNVVWDVLGTKRLKCVYLALATLAFIKVMRPAKTSI